MSIKTIAESKDFYKKLTTIYNMERKTLNNFQEKNYRSFLEVFKELQEYIKENRQNKIDKINHLYGEYFQNPSLIKDMNMDLRKLYEFSNIDEEMLSDDYIKEELFNQYAQDNNFYSKKAQKPTFTLIIGQPGAGKSFLSEASIEEKEGDTIVLDSDLYRKYHPIKEQIDNLTDSEKMLFDESEYATMTHEVAARINDKIREETLNGNVRANLIFETTGPAEWIYDMLKEYKALGYDIEVKYVATQQELSKLSIFTRFLEDTEENGIGRGVPYWVHDKAINNMEEFFQKYVLGDEDNIFSKATINTREEGGPVYDREIDGKKSTALKDVQSREFDKDTLAYIEEAIKKALKRIKKIGLDLSKFEEEIAIMVQISEKYNLNTNIETELKKLGVKNTTELKTKQNNNIRNI